MAPGVRTAALAWLAIASAAVAQLPATPSPASSTPLWAESDAPVPLRLGALVHAHLVYDVYAGNRVVLRAGTRIDGRITGLEPDRQHRAQARWRGDFTRFNKAEVTFTSINLDGRDVPIDAPATQSGTRLMHLNAPAHSQGGIIRRQIAASVRNVKDTWTAVTGPGKGDRLRNQLEAQLPVHPQRIDRKTTWVVTTTTPLEDLAANAVSAPVGTRRNAEPVATATPAPALDAAGAELPIEVVAALDRPLSSAINHPGEAVTATVVQPALASDGSVAIPQGARLQGSVVRARAARRFGRNGELRFSFSRLDLARPGAASVESVQTTLSGIDASADAHLQLDREGNARPKDKDRVIVPLLMLALAGQPLDRDRGENPVGKDAVASNSLGLVGFVVGTAAGWRNVAAGIGYYGAALAIWDRWFRRGAETSFPQYTRLTLETTVRRSAPMEPARPRP